MQFKFRAFRVFQYDYAIPTYKGRANVFDDQGNYLNFDLDSKIHRLNREDAIEDARKLAENFKLTQVTE